MMLTESTGSEFVIAGEIMKNPLAQEKMGPVAAICVLLGSIFVNAYFLKTSFSAMVAWVSQLIGSAVPNGDPVTYVSRLPYGLLMTVFVLIFLIPALWMETRGEKHHFADIMERTAYALMVPVVLLLVSALLMNVSLIAGAVFGLFAAVCVAGVMVSAGQTGGLNGWAICAWTTAFFLITVAMCARNHMVTMFS